MATDRFPTEQVRLESLRERAQVYFPGKAAPPTPAGTEEAAYLAQLLGFFLMLNGGSVTLEEVPPGGE